MINHFLCQVECSRRGAVALELHSRIVVTSPPLANACTCSRSGPRSLGGDGTASFRHAAPSAPLDEDIVGWNQFLGWNEVGVWWAEDDNRSVRYAWRRYAAACTHALDTEGYVFRPTRRGTIAKTHWVVVGFGHLGDELNHVQVIRHTRRGTIAKAKRQHRKIETKKRKTEHNSRKLQQQNEKRLQYHQSKWTQCKLKQWG